MPKKIKLENTHGVVHDRQTGEPKLDITEEWVCEDCRELVEKHDRFCWACGNELQDTAEVEHHTGRGQISHEQFLQMKAMPAKDTPAFLNGIIPAGKSRAQLKQEERDRAEAAPHVRIGRD